MSNKNQVIIHLFNKIPVELDSNENVLFLFDIDGVSCKETIHINENIEKLTIEQIIEQQKSCVVTQEFVDTVKQIRKLPKAKIRFNTGRRDNVKEDTQKMFDKFNLNINVDKDVDFFPNNKKWFKEEYRNVKTDVILNQLHPHDKVIYVDDNDALIENINNKIKDKRLLTILYKNYEDEKVKS